MVHLGFAFVSLYIVYIRLTESIVFVRNVYYGTLIYEMLQAGILFILPAHSLTGSQLTIVPIVAALFTIVILAVFLTFIVERRRQTMLKTYYPRKFNNPLKLERYCLRVY